jgi:hypothetical protein
MQRGRHIPGRFWRGVRLRHALAAADADAAPRPVTLPAAWDDAAAAALATLAPGKGPAVLERAAAGWIGPIAARAGAAGLDPALEERLHRLLRVRRGAPAAPVWHADRAGWPRFVLNLTGFHDPDAGFDCAGFAEAAATAVLALSLFDPEAPRIGVGLADLAGLLAALGLDYDSDAARAVATGLAALLRAVAEAASADLAARFGARAAASAAAPPAPAALPGLAAALAEARAAAAAPARRHLALTMVAPPDAAEALLGVETGGIAPGFSPLDDAGRLTRAARAWLAACGVPPEAALAAALAGHPVFPRASAAAHAAMREAVAPFFDILPALPSPALAQPPAARRRELPVRRSGLAQKAAVGGHRVHLRTGEYADGTLGELAIGLPKESPAFRGLMDAFAHAVSLGLQHGIPLADFVDAFTLTRFGPAGAVEGDPHVSRATSLLDYVFRSLAAHYLGRTYLPEAAPEPDAPDPPSLPLDLPPAADRARRRGLIVVK